MYKKNLLSIIVVIISFAVFFSCKPKKTEQPQPNNPVVQNPEPAKVAHVEDLTVYNLLYADVINQSNTAYNFRKNGFLASKSDSFDLVLYTRMTRVNGKDTSYYSLCGPSYSLLRSSEGTAIKYPKRKTIFYLPKSETSFFKAMFDTIKYEAGIPKIISERFYKVYNAESGEDGCIVQKNIPFLEGQIIGFKTNAGKFGILRITSDGNKAQSNYVKMDVKFQQ